MVPAARTTPAQTSKSLERKTPRPGPHPTLMRPLAGPTLPNPSAATLQSRTRTRTASLLAKATKLRSALAPTSIRAPSLPTTATSPSLKVPRSPLPLPTQLALRTMHRRSPMESSPTWFSSSRRSSLSSEVVLRLNVTRIYHAQVASTRGWSPTASTFRAPTKIIPSDGSSEISSSNTCTNRHEHSSRFTNNGDFTRKY